MSSETRLAASSARPTLGVAGSYPAPQGEGGEPRMITSQIFGYFAPRRGETVIPLDVELHTHMAARERERETGRERGFTFRRFPR